MCLLRRFWKLFPVLLAFVLTNCKQPAATDPDGRLVVMFNGGDAEFGLITKVLDTTEWADLGPRTPLESNSNVRADLLPGPEGVLHRTYTIGGSEPRVTVEVF